MSGKPVNMIDILKLLDKSNCGECGLPACTAFAALAARGQKDLHDCPRLGEEQIRGLGDISVRDPERTARASQERLESLRKAVQELDFPRAAERIGASVNGERLSIPVMGKLFELDRQGNLASACHVNSWVYMPLVNYALHCAGSPLTHRWVPFRDLKQARDWERFFNHRCERGIKQIVDRDPDFFFDAMSLFSPAPAGATSGEAFSSADDVVIVYPMPRLPLMMAYWRADGEFESKLTLFFDTSAEVNLGAESIYILTQGILEMFRRIFSTHGLEDG